MIVRGTIASLALLTLIFTASTDAQVGRSSLATQAAATQNELIEQRIVPHLSYLFEKLVTERRDTTSTVRERSRVVIDSFRGRSRSG
jgi:hypothetical protein